MPFVNKPKCRICRLYTHEHISCYWVKCSKQCKTYTNTYSFKIRRKDIEYGTYSKR